MERGTSVEFHEQLHLSNKKGTRLTMWCVWFKTHATFMLELPDEK